MISSGPGASAGEAKAAAHPIIKEISLRTILNTHRRPPRWQILLHSTMVSTPLVKIHLWLGAWIQSTTMAPSLSAEGAVNVQLPLESKVHQFFTSFRVEFF